ncbi:MULTISPECIES: glycosyltransferase [Bacillus cereus group]|nr:MULTISPECIES: glycosyltransferase [Bacillus cereus group]ONG75255.1 hypothetical protein BKK44_03125 [Bacillus cereus]MCR6794061.1 glycosyltransferase [Bacillus paranthracis]MCU5172495.1 glycosyltransferase [Bacillus paranthracis]MDA2195167.1 glycosyltransferase [Bacillus cereus group sp. Bc238]MDA2200820.1 glycosyltransferase [Bacillus cereus group sp. Bc237]
MKTSIIILTRNKFEYTKLCIESVRKYTQKDAYELIVVDNYSTDETREWLKEQVDVKVIYNSENVGFPKGCNQGIAIAEGENILLLNNDVIVTENWLDNLIMALYSCNDVGAVGPVTNNCSYYQAVRVDYNSIEEMHFYAKGHNISNELLWEERLKLIGFCMLIKKEVVDKIGLLDERFTPGNFEDDDYSFRMRAQGYKTLLCKDTFIHHFGSVSFKDDTSEYSDLLQKNEKKFEEKWGFNSRYSTYIRNEIIDLMDAPKDKKINVLEVGCACGGTLLKIKNIYKNADLFGIEFNEKAASFSSQFANVKAENIENEVLDYPAEFFDYIILADVIEHLFNPWEVMRNLRKYLKKDGQILLSIPNVMHYSLLREVINGKWTYTDSGLLDRTHIRFFTLDEINKMLIEAEYKDIEYGMNQIPKTKQDEEFIEALVSLGTQELKGQYEAYQYLVKASKNSRKPDLKSILLEIEVSLRKNEEYHTDQLDNFKCKEIIENVCLEIKDKVEVLNYLAIQGVNKCNYEDVLLYLEQAFELDNTNTDTLYNLVVVLADLGRTATAKKYFELIQGQDAQIKELFINLYNRNGLYDLMVGLDSNDEIISEVVDILTEDMELITEVIKIIEYAVNNKEELLRGLLKKCHEKKLYQCSILLLRKLIVREKNHEELSEYTDIIKELNIKMEENILDKKLYK